MISVVKDAVFISGSKREFTNNDTGEVRTYCKACFVQGGSDPIVLNIEEDLLETLTEFERCDLLIEITNFDRKFFCKVSGLADGA